MGVSRVEVILIAALTRQGVIGREGALPWHLPQDLAHFRELTRGHPVIMGRKTWDSLPPRFRPLPGRRNVVVTRQTHWEAEGAQRAASVEEALHTLADADRVFIIGGSQIYAQALNRADTLELTIIDQDIQGDVRFPEWSTRDFEEVRRESHPASPPQYLPFAFVTYRRRTPKDPCQ